MCSVATIIALMLLGPPPERTFQLDLLPSRGMAGQDLRVTVRVQPHAGNRYLETVIDCDGFYRSWGEQLSESSALTRRNQFGPMPAGHCVVGAVLFWSDPKQKSGINHKTVIKETCYSGWDVQC